MEETENKPRYDLDKFIANPIDFLNEHFVDESSLGEIDSLIIDVSAEIRNQDRKLMDVIKEKAISGELAHERFEKLQCATNDLIAKMAEIQIPTMRGEQSLKILTADIRALNRAKYNICNTITSLKRILMLSTMLESLREKAKHRKYEEAAGLAVVVRELYQLVSPLREAPPVVRLLTSCNSVLDELKQQIIEDIEIMLDLSTTQSCLETPLELYEVCNCADAIDDSVRKHIASKYAANITQSYENVFSMSADLKILDNIHERFAWLRRIINEFDEKYGTDVPEHWNIQATGAWAFLDACRNQIVAALTSSPKPVEASVILSTLLRCKEFEQELDYRISNYGGSPRPIERTAMEYPEVVPSPKVATSDAEPKKNLIGALSRCFENHLGSWVANEEVQLEDLYNKIVSSKEDGVIMLVLRSAKELFSAISVRLKAVLAVSCEQTLFEMSMVFRRIIAKYQVYLQERVSKIDKNAPLSTLSRQGGYIIATCDYATEMIEHLNDEIVEAIVPAYKEQVNFSSEKEKINVTKANVVKRVVDESCKFAPITPNIVAPLKNLEQRVIEAIQTTIEHLPSGYLHYMTNKVTRGAMAHLKDTIFSLDNASEGYCQQLLLDSYSLQKLLSESVSVLVDPLPLGYVEATTAEMNKLQTLLKVLNSSSDSLGAFDALLIENGGCCTKEEIDQIMEIHRKK
ncbi:Vacuolar protein sorting-associated protein 53 A [Babesia sp. Xinjiang]|uniref:Vacuolar protein sorting-associated protein 53 A n=1 Tax=Babesia sp. Xinjiang TaxID=462227 RepID=UPI000A242F6A|nr:Vacuolar protein sorting-associated protein 53 A [Babesia sp. Xinjiang]XP_028872035.1 Vacuolar protein sorting-associated protein 53 A [Babesia sp. Xinjiang]ORM41553.1 Vacuolar protein sorting-associated protein 53 A [Babesia sp. Xinjiang]ORM41579.1 Vacuolar protein sorting-associated protein 53 A [Babesia sp. Xinjiang]